MEGFARRGREKLAVRDFSGAVADFTAVINYHAFDPPALLSRADAKLALGDIDGAIKDCMQARGPSPVFSFSAQKRNTSRPRR